MGHFLKGGFLLNVRDAWRVPKEGPKGLVRRRVERGFRRNGIRDRWHFPKYGQEGASAEVSKGGIRQSFGLVPEGLIGRASGTRVRVLLILILRRSPRVSSGRTFER